MYGFRTSFFLNDLLTRIQDLLSKAGWGMDPNG